MKEQCAVVITGMHRSGTSLVASMLQEAGVHLGDRLVGAHKGNERGHFENVDIYQFHERVLDRLGQTHLVQTNAVPGPLTASETEEARNLIHYYDEYSLWGWKDPRTSLFLDFWHNILPEARYIFIYRHPIEVVLSLLRRGIELDAEVLAEPFVGLQVWQVYNQAILDFYQKHSEICFLAHVRGVTGDIERFIDLAACKLNLTLQKTNVAARFQAADFKLTALSPETELLLAKIAPAISALYGQLNTRADLSGTRDETGPALSTEQASGSPDLPASSPDLPELHPAIHFSLLLMTLEPQVFLTGKQSLDSFRTARLKRLQHINAKNEQQIENLRQHITDQEADIRALTVQFADLEKRLRAIEHTKVWRLAQRWYTFKKFLKGS